MAYIEDRIDTLEQDFDTMWSKLCALENAVYEITDGDDDHINDRVSTLEDIVENDGHKLDELADSFKKLEEEVKDIKSGIKLNNADIFSRLQHISDRVYGVPKTGDEPQVQQTITEEFVKVVRCKDCKWYIYHDRRCGKFNHCVVVNDYCSRGEKK